MPQRRPAQAIALQTCPEHGIGFIRAAEGDWCIRVGGRVRMDWVLRGTYRGEEGGQTEARIAFDARSRTDWGLLRSVVRLDLISSGRKKTSSYVTFAGFTGGRTSSFFDFYADDLNWRSIAGSDASANLIAYTARGPSGLSATVSLEDARDRQLGFNLLDIGPVGGSGGFRGSVLTEQPSAHSRYPAVIGNARWDGDDASAQLSGAVQRLRPSLCTEAGDLCSAPESRPGYALQVGVQFSIPQLARGDTLTLQAAYAVGALSYLGVGNIPDRVGNLQLMAADGDILRRADAEGEVFRFKQARGWSALAAFLHYWTPTLRQAFFGSYLSVDGPDWAQSVGTQAVARPEVGFLQLGTNLVWAPVPGFEIGAEIGYGRAAITDVSFPLLSTTNIARSSGTQFYAISRVQRTF
jgi:hypothetical protein